MTKGTSIQIRLTKQQKERFILAMQNAGFKTISGFIRSIVLEYDLSSQQMIAELHKKFILGEDVDGKSKTSLPG